MSLRSGRKTGWLHRRRGGVGLAVTVTLSFLTFLTVAAPPSSAVAQERPRTIPDMLFGGQPQRRPYRIRPTVEEPQPVRRQAPRRSERRDSPQLASPTLSITISTPRNACTPPKRL